MIQLTRSELRQLAQTFILANTPASLLNGILRSSATTKLKVCRPEELSDYYDRITARAGRTEIVIALAYAVLFAILAKARDPKNAPVDVTRLKWGEQIKVYLSFKPVTNTQLIVIPGEPTPSVQTFQSPGATLKLVGANGQQLTWRNND